MRGVLLGLLFALMNGLGVVQAAEAAREIDWDALIPSDFRLDGILEKYNLQEFDDSDPRAQEIMDEIRAAWDAAPVVKDIDGQLIRLPGYVVPLELNADGIHQFLLVPYYGACIHVPPPPANQTIYVTTEDTGGVEIDMFLPVWVTGVIRAERVSSELAESGYRIEATLIEPYEEEPVQ